MRKKEIFLIFLVILIYLFFVSMSINKPYMGDEVELIKVAKAIAETGKPIYNSNLIRPSWQGLWHPPLYINLLAIPFYFFGNNPIGLRGVSVIFGIGAIFLVYLITKKIVKKRGEFWAIIAVIIYSLNPLTIQSAILIDIDGGLLNFLTLLFIYFWISDKGNKYLIPVLFLISWTKETSIILLFFSLIIYYCVNKNWNKAGKVVLSFAIAGILFLISFLLYCKFLNLDFLQLFGGITSNATPGISITGIMRSAWSFKTFIYFVIPIWVFLFIFVLCKRFFGVIRERGFEKSDIFGIFSVLAILMFVYVGSTGWNFPKYYIAVLSFGTIFIIKNMADKISKISIDKKTLIKLIIFALLLIFCLFLLLRDPILPEISASAENINSFYELYPIMKSFLMYALVPIFAFLLIFSKESARNKQGVYYLVFILLVVSLYLDCIQASADYSTHNIYGDRGLREVIKFAEQNNISSNQIATYFHLGYYLGKSNYYEITMVYLKPELFKEKIVENAEVRYLIIYKKDIKKIGENMKFFREKEIIRNYYVFEKII